MINESRRNLLHYPQDQRSWRITWVSVSRLFGREGERHGLPRSEQSNVRNTWQAGRRAVSVLGCELTQGLGHNFDSQAGALAGAPDRLCFHSESRNELDHFRFMFSPCLNSVLCRGAPICLTTPSHLHLSGGRKSVRVWFVAGSVPRLPGEPKRKVGAPETSSPCFPAASPTGATWIPARQWAPDLFQASYQPRLRGVK